VFEQCQVVTARAVTLKDFHRQNWSHLRFLENSATLAYGEAMHLTALKKTRDCLALENQA
jgi:hypothetical protein